MGIFDCFIDVWVSPVQLDIVKVIVKVHDALKPPVLNKSSRGPQGKLTTNQGARGVRCSQITHLTILVCILYNSDYHLSHNNI